MTHFHIILSGNDLPQSRNAYVYLFFEVGVWRVTIKILYVHHYLFVSNAWWQQRDEGF
jgi:hypothetical protein